MRVWMMRLLFAIISATANADLRRVVLVTGGSRGIGRAISQKFAERGDQVVINYLSNRAAADELMGQLPGEGHSVTQCDVSNPSECLRMVEQISSRYGRLDVLVNNAAIYGEVSFLGSSYESWVAHWEQHLASNVMGPACLAWCAAQLMARSPKVSNAGGAIIGVTSRGAKRGEPDAVAYGASKAALNSMCQSLAASLGSSNIAVCAVAPGFIETDMAKIVLEGSRGDDVRAQSPFGRVGTPEEVASAVVFLAEPTSRWCSGCVLDCNGASYLH